MSRGVQRAAYMVEIQNVCARLGEIRRTLNAMDDGDQRRPALEVGELEVRARLRELLALMRGTE